MEDPARHQLLTAAFTEPETLVGNHLLRPINLASYDVMLRTGNPLIKGDPPSEGTPNTPPP
ncbi:MAG: hypothetical protein NTW21_22885 [Verrucomicrobia bacterium]|nr:hypothetical protein [Verrucomicrobiota bacterium]